MMLIWLESKSTFSDDLFRSNSMARHLSIPEYPSPEPPSPLANIPFSEFFFQL